MARAKSALKHWSLPVLAAIGVSVVGLALKSACAPWSWGGAAETYTRLCYSDLGPLYWVRGLASGVLPYFESFEGSFIEYPVLTGMWMWLIARITELVVGVPSVDTFVALTWATSVVFIAFTVALMARHSTGNRRAAWWFAFSPALLLVLGINWDALAVLCAVAALIFYQRNKLGFVGVAIGVGAAAKLFPALLLVPLIAHLLTHRKFKAGLRESVQLAALAFATWLMINLPFILFAREGWLEFYRFSRVRGIDFGSLPLGLNYVFGITVTTEFANTVGLIAVGVTSVLLLIFAKRLNIYQSAFAIVSVFVLVNKVYSPQFWLWMTALLVMTGISRRAFIFWNIAEAIYFVGIWRFLLFTQDPSASGAIDYRTYGWIVLLHWLSTLTITVYALSSQKVRNL